MGITSKQRGAQMNIGGTINGIRQYSADGPVSPVFSHTAILNKAGVGAYTLAAPARAGLELELISDSANAHVVTATSLIMDGVTGVPHTTLTFGAFNGASIGLRSFGGKWYVTFKNVVAVT